MTSDREALTIPSFLQDKAKRSYEAIAAPTRVPLSYQQLLEQTVHIIRQLRAIGIQRNDKVAIALPNGPEAAVAFLSISSGATCAPLNPNYRASEYEFYLRDLEAKALIVQSGVAQPAVEVAEALNIPILELAPALDCSAGLFELLGIQSTQRLQAKDIDFAEPDDIALILHTSGTTSRPKMVPLSQQNLCISAINVSTTLALQKSDRCLNVMPLFHIHGLIGALLSSISAGASVVCTPGFYAPIFLEWMNDCQTTWYSAVPTMHQQILSRALKQPDLAKGLPVRFIRSSSAPLPPQIMVELEQIFNAPAIEAYGMTEAAHQMACNPLPPKQRKPGSVGRAAGPAVQIMDEQGALLPAGTVGEVVIKGENVTQGYANNPEANAGAFTNGWFRTGDLGSLDEDGYLFLKGRIKEIINRGGEKISPREVDEVLLAHPAIAQVVTFAAPHTLLGEDVAVAVVLEDNTTVSEQDLKAFAARKLADYKVPRVVLFLDEIPKGPTGKRQRIGLAEKLGLSASNPDVERADYVAPRTSVEKTLADIWADVLEVRPIGIYDNFFQLGGDSILSTQIINRVKAAFQVELSFLIFFQQPTVANMAIAIAQLQSETVDSDEMNRLLAELDTLSEAEAQKLL